MPLDSKKNVLEKPFIASIQIIVAAFILFHTTALAGPGGCVNFDFPLDAHGRVDWPRPVTIVEEGAPVYLDATSSPTSGDRLPFNTNLWVLKAQKHRVQVHAVNSSTPLGWVNRSSLLCTSRPVPGDSGLDQKFFPYTATPHKAKQDTVNSIQAYPTSNLKEYNEKYKTLENFNSYYVYDVNDRHHSYLLGYGPRLDQFSQLVGWVSRNNGVLWDTAMGLRPEADIASACAYASLENALDKNQCIPVPGGNDWYLSAFRIPVIKKIQKNNTLIREVLLPISNSSTSGPQIEFKMPHKTKTKNDKNLSDKQISKPKAVHVLFLIDGTENMEPYLIALKKTIRSIDNGIGAHSRNDFNARFPTGFDIRLGFRIYRDTYAGMKDTGQGSNIFSPCEFSSDDERQKHFRNLLSALDDIKIFKDYSDDYEDNLFGGLLRAINDLETTCQSNLKILFIIGDHGYNPLSQEKRGVEAINIRTITNGLNGDLSSISPEIIPFFIHADTAISGEINPQRHKAYQLFRTQSISILKDVLPNDPNPLDHYISSTSSNLKSSILHSLNSVLSRFLENDSQMTDMAQLSDNTSPRASTPSKLKDSQKFHFITAYIPSSGRFAEDIWLKSEDLLNWQMLLRELKLSNLNHNEMRRAFVLEIWSSLEKVFNAPLLDYDKPLEMYIQSKGRMPIRNNSPLFRYSITQLMDKGLVPDCELDYLTKWIIYERKILNIISDGHLKPVYDEPKPLAACPSATESPQIKINIRGMPIGGSPQHRLDHEVHGVRAYWVPEEYLP